MKKLEVMSTLSVLIRKKVFDPLDIKRIVDEMGDEAEPGWVLERLCQLELLNEENVQVFANVCSALQKTK